MTTGQTDRAFETLKYLFGEEKYETNFTPSTKERIRKQYRTFMLKSHAISGNRWDLLSSEYIVISLILFILWWTCSYVYYGFIYSLPAIYQKLHLDTKQKESVDQHLYDDIIADVILSCLFEIPAAVLDALLPVIIGRRNSILLGFLFTGAFTFLCCISTSAIPVYAAVSKATITLSFHTLYTFAAEVYPTYMRTTAIGMCNFFSRIGGFSTSFINEYLIGLHIIAPFIGFTSTCFICLVLTLFLKEPDKNKVY
jgi:MFS family permease